MLDYSPVPARKPRSPLITFQCPGITLPLPLTAAQELLASQTQQTPLPSLAFVRTLAPNSSSLQTGGGGGRNATPPSRPLCTWPAGTRPKRQKATEMVPPPGTHVHVPGMPMLIVLPESLSARQKKKKWFLDRNEPPLPGEQANRYLGRLRSNILDAGFTEAADCFRGECNRKREHHSRLAKEDNRSGGHTRGRQEWVNPYVCMGEAL